ncbi:MAG: JAB domain-containing protein [Gammaproteobacteria bacterium]|nr:JAB domain-containing protein [Gammaproteobacteria bacterium]MDZ7752957.1 JAB domain-containing protein [Gammaproteobacteria bacterium]MDZ7753267.1 JAB domain-containing protein [Gammaproteobacteria bacterium]
MPHPLQPDLHDGGDRFVDLRPLTLNAREKQTVIALALAILKQRHCAGRAFTKPEDTRAYLRIRLAEHKAELFGAFFLDNRHRIIKAVDLFHGTIDGASVYPRIVVQRALEANAAAIVCFHNHPSGVAEPSHADEAITRRLKEALALVDIRLLDHFVVAAGESVSFAERGLL